MNTRYSVTRSAALAFAVVGSMFAGAAFAEDKMNPENKVQDHMKSDGMKPDAMKSGHMDSDGTRPDAMKSGHMGSDAMGGEKK